MDPVDSSFFDGLKSFVNKRKVACIVTLGLAILVYAFGDLAGRTVSWIAKCSGTTKKTDNLFKQSTSECNLPPVGITDASQDQSSFQIIQWSNANKKVRDQIKEMWPRRIKKIEENTVLEGDRIVCIIDKENLVGCVALEQMATQLQDFAEEVTEKKVYKLDIKISIDYQGKGCGRKLFNHACKSIIEEGALVFIVNKAAPGVGDRLYGGEKTRELFDVYYLLKGSQGEYLLKRKETQEKRDLNYIKINREHSYIFYKAIESLEGINHLVHYLIEHPEEVSFVRTLNVSPQKVMAA